jgi:hypothetical protein
MKAILSQKIRSIFTMQCWRNIGQQAQMREISISGTANCESTSWIPEQQSVIGFLVSACIR